MICYKSFSVYDFSWNRNANSLYTFLNKVQNKYPTFQNDLRDHTKIKVYSSSTGMVQYFELKAIQMLQSYNGNFLNPVYAFESIEPFANANCKTLKVLIENDLGSSA